MNHVGTEHFQIPSPLQEIVIPELTLTKLFIKRDDLIHPLVSGNKWRKLEHALKHLEQNSFTQVITFGGPFSNHIVATAIACQKRKIPCLAFIRTDEIDPLNPTLQICQSAGMTLIPTSRSNYKQYTQGGDLRNIIEQYPDAFILPEGGSSSFALNGMHHMVKEINQIQSEIDHYFCSFGTGATSCGILQSLNNNQTLNIVPAIKGVNEDEIHSIYNRLTNEETISNTFEINYSLEDKAYAKKDVSLFLLAEDFLNKHGILLDPIYTSKTMRYLINNIGKFQGKTICFIHTGGIQAWNGYFYRFPTLKEKLPSIYSYMKEYNNGLFK